MEKVRVATVCSHSILGDIEGNLAMHLERIREASEQGADFVCFPELSLTGYAMPQSSEITLSLDSEPVKRLVSASEEFNICVIFGISEVGRYITQVVAEDGKIVGTYRKTHLGEREAAAMNAGDELPVFKTSKATIAIQTCWESHFPEITLTYALKGADIVFMPHASGLAPEKRRSTWNKVIPARAYDNTVFCASCNQVGDNGLGTVFGGGSLIVDARGNMLAEDYSGECMLVAELDGNVQTKLRSPGYESMKDLHFVDKRRADLYLK
ncbi:MAG: nitrilase [archaeon]|nr:nitrilase [archaeon]